MTDRHAEIEAVIRDLALAAGRVIMEVYARVDFGTRAKADASPVTEADLAADRLIAAGLARAFPDIPAVTEEQASSHAETGHRRFFLVDPLDGTREFIRRRGEFTVNIALIEDGVPVLGVVHAPALEVTYAAAGPGTATVERGDNPAQPITARTMPADGAVAVGSRSHGDRDRMQKLVETINIAAVEVAGSSIMFCLVADGRADIYPRYGNTHEWDTAAAHAVLRAAGGSVRTLDDAELAYGKPGFENPPFVVRGRDD